jgi:ABC-type Mn2+/Zn2+ transport system permease subunit
VGTVMAVAAVVGVVSSYVGLLISYHADLAAGASIILTSVLIFALCAAGVEIQRWQSHRRDIHHDHDHPHLHEHVHLR